MVLFDQVVQALRDPDLRVIGQRAIECDRLWTLVLMFDGVEEIPSFQFIYVYT